MCGFEDLVLVKSVIMKIGEPKLLASKTYYFLNSPFEGGLRGLFYLILLTSLDKLVISENK